MGTNRLICNGYETSGYETTSSQINIYTSLNSKFVDRQKKYIYKLHKSIYTKILEKISHMIVKKKYIFIYIHICTLALIL